jgi:hypothetical protein
MPTPGSCSDDSDCIVAYCSDWGCQCGGWVIAQSQLGENACLIEDGASVPPACTAAAQDAGGFCDCPVHPFCIPQCDAGTCACELGCNNGETVCNGECTDTQMDPGNCGSCGHVCPVGPDGMDPCINGFCEHAGVPDAGVEDGGGTDTCSTTNFCACMNFCVSTCQCGDGGCPLTQVCEGALCPNSCPSGEACGTQSGGVSMCTPLCTPEGSGGQGSCQAGMTCRTVCT